MQPAVNCAGVYLNIRMRLEVGECLLRYRIRITELTARLRAVVTAGAGCNGQRLNRVRCVHLS